MSISNDFIGGAALQISAGSANTGINANAISGSTSVAGAFSTATSTAIWVSDGSGIGIHISSPTGAGGIALQIDGGKVLFPSLPSTILGTDANGLLISTTVTSSGGSGSGIVSPGTFTWTNTYGIGVSTINATAGYYMNGSQFLSDESSSAGQGTFVGATGRNTTSFASHPTCIGYGACSALTTGANVTAIGFQAGTGLTSGTSLNDICIGSQSCGSATTANRDICIGVSACSALTTNGSSNSTAIGDNAMPTATTPNQDTCVGSDCFDLLQTGINNVGMGTTVAGDLTTGSYNTCLGDNFSGGGQACSGITTGSNNVMIGAGATGALISVNGASNNNTYIGTDAGVAGSANQITDSICLGYKCVVTSSNTAVIGHIGTVDSVIVSMSTMTVSSGTVTTLNAGTLTLTNPLAVAQGGTGVTTINTCQSASNALTWTGSAFGCNTISGGGGGSSTLAIQQNAVNITSPTVAVNFLSPPFSVTLVNGSTSQISLLGSSVTLRGNAWAASVDASTAAIYTQFGLVATSTNAIYTQFGAVATSTNAIVTRENLTAAATTQVAIDTTTLQTNINGKQATGNYITALTGPVTASGPGSVATSINLAAGNVSGQLPSSLMVSTVGYTTSTQTWSGSNTFQNNIYQQETVNGSLSTYPGAWFNITESSTSDALVTTIAMEASATNTITSSGSLRSLVGGQTTATNGSNKPWHAITGSYTQATHNSTSTIDTAIGMSASASNQGGGIISKAQDGYFTDNIFSGSTTTLRYGVYIDNPYTSGIGSEVLTNYGLYVAAQTSGVTTNYGIYSAGANNVFVGSTTFNDQVTLSSGVYANGSVGTSGQVLSSQGPGLSPKWIAQSGGGGSSTLAVGYGTTAGYKVQTSSPTGALNFDQSQFLTSLPSGTTAFITIAYSTNAITGNSTLTSTQTVIITNCSSSCTQTLPTAVGISGKFYMIKMIGVGPVTIATTSSQTIDGSTTIIPSPNQWADIEVVSDGSNWEIL
jgi:hypothetical protein